MTVVERVSSSGGLYEFAGHDETYFFVDVRIPARQGCSSWKFGSEGN